MTAEIGDMSQTNQRRIFIAMLSVIFLLADYLMGPYVAFPITFIIPISLTAWWFGRTAGIVIATIMMLARLGCGPSWELPIPNLLAYKVINAIIREIVFVLLVLLVDRVAVQQRALEHKLKVLEGILPICSYCHKIRNEADEWEQMERYITRKTNAEFSHSICPDCREQYFGHLRRTAP